MNSTSAVTHPVRYERFTHEDGRLVRAEGRLRFLAVAVPRELVAVLGEEIELAHDGATVLVRLEALAVESCAAGCPSPLVIPQERATHDPLGHVEHTPPQGWPQAVIDSLCNVRFEIREGRA
jgi:hypothetical protein